MTHINFAMATLLNGIFQGTILAAAMWVVLKMLPRLNSTTRFTVLWLTLLAVVALPIGLLSHRVPTIAGTQPDAIRLATTNVPVVETFAPLEVRSSELNAAANPVSHPASISGLDLEAVSQRGSESALRNAASLVSSAVVQAVDHPLVRIRSRKVLAAIEILWALLSLAMLARLAGGYRELRRLNQRRPPTR